MGGEFYIGSTAKNWFESSMSKVVNKKEKIEKIGIDLVSEKI